LRQNMTKALEPPKPKTKIPDISDELSKLFDDGTQLESERNRVEPESSVSPRGRQSPHGSQSPRGSQSETAIPARRNDSQPESDSQPRGDSQPANLLASLSHTPGFLRLPNTVTDSLLRLLDTDAQAVYIQLYRLSHGNSKPLCWISLPKLAERTNIKMTSLKVAIKRLEERGLIRKNNINLGYGKQQGVEYSVSSPDSQPSPDSQSPRGSQSRGDPIKETHIKETHTNTEGVGVSSRFSLAECRRYADSLRADGITNPGGYATKIQRSGEADELIAKFLEPAESAKVVDSRACPDCHGTGFYEPGGTGKGVARCKHERLLETK